MAQKRGRHEIALEKLTTEVDSLQGEIYGTTDSMYNKMTRFAGGTISFLSYIVIPIIAAVVILVFRPQFLYTVPQRGEKQLSWKRVLIATAVLTAVIFAAHFGYKYFM